MLKIMPYNYQKYKTPFKAEIHKKSADKKSSSAKKGIITGTATLAAAGAIIYGVCAFKSKKTDTIVTELKNQMKKFPHDIKYRETIAEAAGVKKSEIHVLRSVIGPEEYQELIKTFDSSSIHYTPGKTLITEKPDNYELTGKINKTYRANLHMHTTNSDGKMSVAELLDKSAKYADEGLMVMVTSRLVTETDLVVY